MVWNVTKTNSWYILTSLVNKYPCILVSVCLKKPLCASPRHSNVSRELPLKQNKNNMWPLCTTKSIRRAELKGCSLSSLCCRFFTEIASDCETLDAGNHNLSFINDANVLALHRLLWNNQEKIGDYLSSSRYFLHAHLRRFWLTRVKRSVGLAVHRAFANLPSDLCS